MGNVRNTDRWGERFSSLAEFALTHGHCFVPRSFVTADGFKLGIWTAEQRRRRDKHSEEDWALLESLPEWTWDASDVRWRVFVIQLRRFADAHGNTDVPQGLIMSDGFPLGAWVSRVRREHMLGILPRRRLDALHDLPEWRW